MDTVTNEYVFTKKFFSSSSSSEAVSRGNPYSSGDGTIRQQEVEANTTTTTGMASNNTHQSNKINHNNNNNHNNSSGGGGMETFDKIFARTLSLLLEQLENYLFNCYDCLALLLSDKNRTRQSTYYAPQTTIACPRHILSSCHHATMATIENGYGCTIT